ncbi:MAG: hypothetical protein OEX02_16020 [Cyclobacteriaceae bacterium]|nr:hypothetical protein [Cyclobacteriaceae bacterium]
MLDNRCVGVNEWVLRVEVRFEKTAIRCPDWSGLIWSKNKAFNSN